jgi:hypothetical protein
MTEMQRRRSQAYWVAAAMRRLPTATFCCGCVCLEWQDRRQLRRVFRIVRSVRNARLY